MPKLNISQIHPYAFAHPSDRKASDALRTTPFLPELLRKVAKWNVEEKLRAHFMYNSIRVGGPQFASLDLVVQQVAEEFGMEAPETYVSREGGVNAFAFGLERNSIVLTADLIDLMTEEEIRAVIAHELAHILCEHLLYRSVAIAITAPVLPGATALPAALVRRGALGLLYSWYRSAEYTADRASLLIIQDSKVIVSVLAKLAGVPASLAEEFDPVYFLEQAREYKSGIQSQLWTKLVTSGMGLFLSHPEPVKRAVAITTWEGTQQYRDILEGRYLTVAEFQARDRFKVVGTVSCSLCRRVNDLKAIHCIECGLNLDPAQQVYCDSGHVNDLEWNFCHACQADLGGFKESEIEVL